MVKHCSFCIYVEIRPSLLKLNLCYKQISLNLAIFDGNGVILERKKLFFSNTHLWVLDSSSDELLLNVCCLLIKLVWILNVYGFLPHLAYFLPNCLHTIDLALQAIL